MTTFCAVAYGTAVSATSSNGATWVEHPLPASRTWIDICYGGGLFVTVAAGTNKVAISTDGITWSEYTLPVSRNWTKIGYNAGVFCIISDSEFAVTSVDGITWFQRTLPVYTNNGIASNGSVFCVVSDAGGPNAYTSANGSTWTVGSLSHGSIDIAFNGTTFCAVQSWSNVTSTSNNGLTWADATAAGFMGFSYLGAGNGIFCGVSVGPDTMTSADGINWAVNSGVIPSQSWSRPAWNGSKFCCVAMGSSQTVSSVNGITWTINAMPAARTWMAIAASSALVVIIPVANFTGTPLKGNGPLTVAFTDTSINAPTSWAWTFGDGATSTTQNPTHTYAVKGVYTVTLTVTNTAGSNTLIRTGYVEALTSVFWKDYINSEESDV